MGVQTTTYLKTFASMGGYLNRKKLLAKKHYTAKECKRLLPRFLEMVKELKHSAFQHLRTLGNTLFKWREEVVRMLRFTKNNGITEGFHRKTKLIQRRSYGFRNFENYRLRVRVLCGWVKCPRIWGRAFKDLSITHWFYWFLFFVPLGLEPRTNGLWVTWNQ